MTYSLYNPLADAWRVQLDHVLVHGRKTRPRDLLTLEVPSKTLVFNMNRPVVTQPTRDLGYKFMAAEAWWILNGRADVEAIAPYSKVISQFSDDGVKFFGAYGPPLVDQLPYVVSALRKDPDTRQATLTFWRPNPPATKDYPCTIAMTFLLREGHLETHVFMRSSDNWLGVPYDAFNFSMISCEVLRRVNMGADKPWEQTAEHTKNSQPMSYRLGNCHLTAASSHLYERNWEAASQVVSETPPVCGQVPAAYYHSTVQGYVELELSRLKDTEAGHPDRWWA